MKTPHTLLQDLWQAEPPEALEGARGSCVSECRSTDLKLRLFLRGREVSSKQSYETGMGPEAMQTAQLGTPQVASL